MHIHIHTSQGICIYSSHTSGVLLWLGANKWVIFFKITSMETGQYSYDCNSGTETTLEHTMTSSNGNISALPVLAFVCWEFSGHRWIPRTKASDAELWCFLWSTPWINGWINNREAGDLRCIRSHYDVIVMIRVDRSHESTKNAWYNHKTHNKAVCLLEECCARSRYQWQGQIITSHRYCGM